MNKARARNDIVEVGKRLYQKGFVASNDGNISIRLDNNSILITPTGVSKGYMTEEDLIIVDMHGNVISGCRKPTSELKMHLAVYRQRSDIFGICHAHPPIATAFAVAHLVSDRISLPEMVFALGKISLTDYATPTTDEVPESISKVIHNSEAILLANHGALTLGSDVMDAYYKMETLEHFSKITFFTRLLGGEKYLTDEQVKSLLRVRHEIYGKPEKDLC